MHTDEIVAKLKTFIASGLIFTFSGYFAYGELKFAIWGKTSEATVTKTHETRSKRGEPVLAVEYQFTEADGTGRNGHDEVPIYLPKHIGANSKIQVQYLPGVAQASRLECNSSMGLFLTGCLGLGVAVFLAWNEIRSSMDGRQQR